jgi:hypothetical protein
MDLLRKVSHVVATRLSMDVTDGSQGRLIPGDYKSQDLRLWRFIMHPSGQGEEAGAEDAKN